MLVVNTTSATLGAGSAAWRWPRKRVPSSRRRNPGRERSIVTIARYGLFASAAGGFFASGDGGGRGGGRGRALGRRERTVEHRGRRATAAREDLEHEREADEDASAPPARLREQVPGLQRAEERIRGRGCSAETRGQPTALTGLQQDGGPEHQGGHQKQGEGEPVEHQDRGRRRCLPASSRVKS